MMLFSICKSYIFCLASKNFSHMKGPTWPWEFRNFTLFIFWWNSWMLKFKEVFKNFIISENSEISWTEFLEFKKSNRPLIRCASPYGVPFHGALLRPYKFLMRPAHGTRTHEAENLSRTFSFWPTPSLLLPHWSVPFISNEDQESKGQYQLSFSNFFVQSNAKEADNEMCSNLVKPLVGWIGKFYPCSYDDQRSREYWFSSNHFFPCEIQAIFQSYKSYSIIRVIMCKLRMTLWPNYGFTANGCQCIYTL